MSLEEFLTNLLAKSDFSQLKHQMEVWIPDRCVNRQSVPAFRHNTQQHTLMKRVKINRATKGTPTNTFILRSR